MEIFITPIYKKADVVREIKTDLPPCPICGAKAFISKNIADGFYFGWSVGCPRYKLNDKIHKHNKNTPYSERLTIFGLNSKEECIEKWNEKVNNYDRQA